MSIQVLQYGNSLNLQNKQVYPKGETVVYSADDGYDGIKQFVLYQCYSNERGNFLIRNNNGTLQLYKDSTYIYNSLRKFNVTFNLNFNISLENDNYSFKILENALVIRYNQFDNTYYLGAQGLIAYIKRKNDPVIFGGNKNTIIQEFFGHISINSQEVLFYFPYINSYSIFQNYFPDVSSTNNTNMTFWFTGV